MRDKIGFLKCFGSLKVLVSLQELFVVFFINVILNQKHCFATVYPTTPFEALCIPHMARIKEQLLKNQNKIVRAYLLHFFKTLHFLSIKP